METGGGLRVEGDADSVREVWPQAPPSAMFFACFLFAFCLLFVCFLVACCLLFVCFVPVFVCLLLALCLLFVCFLFVVCLCFTDAEPRRAAPTHDCQLHSSMLCSPALTRVCRLASKQSSMLESREDERHVGLPAVSAPPGLRDLLLHQLCCGGSLRSRPAPPRKCRF